MGDRGTRRTGRGVRGVKGAVRRCGGARDRSRVLTSGVVVVAVVAPLTVMAISGAGHPVAEFTQTTGTAWVASPDQGLVSLVDGSSEEIVAAVRLPVAAGGLDVVQAGASAYVSDIAAGTVARVDGATFEASAPVRFATPGGGVVVLQGGGEVYVLDPAKRTAMNVDAETLRVQGTVSLAAVPRGDQAVVDDTGRLWVVDSLDGGLTWFADEDNGVQPEVDANTALVLVRGRPALIDLTNRQVAAVGQDGAVGTRSCLDVRSDETIQVLGSETEDEVYAAVSETGNVIVAALGHDDCRRVISVADPGTNDFGPLAQSDRFVFVPNRTTGTTTVIDTRDESVAGTFPLAEPGHDLQLTSKDGLVFYNDLDSQTTGVLKLNHGTWTRGDPLDKYNPDTGEAIITTPSAPQPTQEPTAAPTPPETVPPAGVPPTEPPPTDVPPTEPPPTEPPATAAPLPPVPLSPVPLPPGSPAAPESPTAPGEEPPSSPPTAPATGPVIASLASDKRAYEIGGSATITATVTATPQATWTWEATRDGTAVPLQSQPASGHPLTLPLDVAGTYAVALTVTDNGLQTRKAVTFPVSTCTLDATPLPIDLRTATSTTLHLSAPGCVNPAGVVLTPQSWLGASSASVTINPGATVDVTITRTGEPLADGLNTAAITTTINGCSGPTWDVFATRTVLDSPVALSPADGEVFSLYPRTTTLSWTAVPGADQYIVEVEYYAPGVDEWVWEPHGGSPMTVATTTATFDFVGAQPGHWRVLARDSTGRYVDSAPTPWWMFEYTI